MMPLPTGVFVAQSLQKKRHEFGLFESELCV
jgi:hypothetical protein